MSSACTYDNGDNEHSSTCAEEHDVAHLMSRRMPSGGEDRPDAEREYDAERTAEEGLENEAHERDSDRNLCSIRL